MPAKSSRKRMSKKMSARSGATQGDGSSYVGQAKVRLTLPAVQVVAPTTITTGVIAVATSVSSSDVSGFATRFGSTFDEYRILSARIKVRSLGVNPGVSRFWFDEKSSAAPTVNDAYERVGVTVTNNSADPRSTFTMKWTARDLLDLQYSPIGTATTPVFFKVYTDLATFGAPATVTNLWLLEFDITFEFRGLKTV